MVAPLTFLAIAGRRVQQEIFTKFSIPINLARVFHRDQKFTFHRPILGGDKLYFDTYLDSVIEFHGTVLAEIRSEVTDAEGNPVVTSVVTMLGKPTPEHRRHRCGNRINIGRNVESRSSDRKDVAPPGQQPVERLLNRLTHLIGQLECHHRVVGVAGRVIGRVDRLTERDIATSTATEPGPPGRPVGTMA